MSTKLILAAAVTLAFMGAAYASEFNHGGLNVRVGPILSPSASVSNSGNSSSWSNAAVVNSGNSSAAVIGSGNSAIINSGNSSSASGINSFNSVESSQHRR